MIIDWKKKKNIQRNDGHIIGILLVQTPFFFAHNMFIKYRIETIWLCVRVLTCTYLYIWWNVHIRTQKGILWNANIKILAPHMLTQSIENNIKAYTHIARSSKKICLLTFNLYMYIVLYSSASEYNINIIMYLEYFQLTGRHPYVHCVYTIYYKC